MFCPKCGEKIESGMSFCVCCGTKLEEEPPEDNNLSDTIAQQNNQSSHETPQNVNTGITPINRYDGVEREFSLLGAKIVIPPSIDAFNYYRKSFKSAAIQLQKQAATDYFQYVINLDTFLTIFPQIFSRYIQPLFGEAYKILLQHDIYDLTMESFFENHKNDFNECEKTYDAVIKAFNDTIAFNQQNVINSYNMLPTVFFSGFTGLIAATFVNMGVSAAMESSIKKANVSRPQREQMFRRINHDSFVYDIFRDYWNVHYSLTFQLNRHGMNVWFPNIENNQKAHNLVDNIKRDIVPPDKLPMLLCQVFEARPYVDDLFIYLNSKYPNNPEVYAISEYFGFDGVRV